MDCLKKNVQHEVKLKGTYCSCREPFHINFEARITIFNDMVNAYLRLLERRSLLAPTPPTIWSFASFFLVAWRHGGFARVERWTGEQNILDRDVILFPVLLEAEFRWVLASAFPKIMEIHIYDSLRRSRPKLAKEIQSYLTDYATSRECPILQLDTCPELSLPPAKPRRERWWGLHLLLHRTATEETVD
ncbi:uncharacterized protein LOC128984798 [Macrosteles quadrilineatus]|uniref:uncharacterized protein LOC128984798 n=1 Tax=Macrosteles quadrilineatus TaxID=74068 RepID=UPI0023E2D34D|nr:uncharacterized protein LOC128984798 [Macrosteles quadrilineatus]